MASIRSLVNARSAAVCRSYAAIFMVQLVVTLLVSAGRAPDANSASAVGAGTSSHFLLVGTSALNSVRV